MRPLLACHQPTTTETGKWANYVVLPSPAYLATQKRVLFMSQSSPPMVGRGRLLSAIGGYYPVTSGRGPIQYLPKIVRRQCTSSPTPALTCTDRTNYQLPTSAAIAHSCASPKTPCRRCSNVGRRHVSASPPPKPPPLRASRTCPSQRSSCQSCPSVQRACSSCNFRIFKVSCVLKPSPLSFLLRMVALPSVSAMFGQGVSTLEHCVVTEAIQYYPEGFTWGLPPEAAARREIVASNWPPPRPLPSAPPLARARMPGFRGSCCRFPTVRLRLSVLRR